MHVADAAEISGAAFYLRAIRRPAPGAPDEDRDGGFEYGGWTFPYADEDFGEAMAGWLGQAAAFLLGRKTYEMFSDYWPQVTDPGHPIASPLNALPKYVASTSLTSLDWHNASLLTGNVAADVATLKLQPGGELQVHGSGNLAQTLIAHDLVDEYRLLTFPVLLGRGKKLFGDGTPGTDLRLTDSKTTGAGVIVATYEPAGPVRQGSFVEN
jgi:dihydrofolate reductase